MSPKEKFLSKKIDRGGITAMVALLILGAEAVNQQEVLKRFTFDQIRRSLE
ncbi:hypothetical protein L1765_11260 [Microaerobacter geothermalis]|uniref:hypothetical protein n=1 Tax=Microaerobacter geothermalis TaxID=674972 RepID=UPI001F15A75E|nr:hypothetical protein [Microaerobacter geothermalis]MCF6094541.1 hypothetical protein [Microaerobacter geothermalis]